MCCKANEVVNDCWSACNRPVCPQIKRTLPQACIAMCIPDVCECGNGTVRNECGDCIHPSDCHKKCSNQTSVICSGPNEMYYPCLERRRTCEDRPKCECKNCQCSPCKCSQRSPPQEKCPVCALATCDCKTNFYRNKYAICVHESECDNAELPGIDVPCSDQNEERRKLYRKCDENTCGPKRKCVGDDAKYKRNVCICKKNKYRNRCGKCIPKERCSIKDPCKCSNPCKDKNYAWQFYNGCLNKTCEFYKVAPLILCGIDNGNFQCQCKDNTYYDKVSGKCVSGQKCPK